MLAALGGAENAGEYHYDDAVIRTAVLAALKAMREPSEGMADVAHDGRFDINWGYCADGRPWRAEDVWRAMIDALLSESPG